MSRRIRPVEPSHAYLWRIQDTNDLNPYSHHPYAYVLGDPINFTDPTGKCATWLIGDPTCEFIGWDRVSRGDLEYQDAVPWGGAAVDFTPGVGDVKGLIEVFTGCDIITGENLGNWRWLGLLGASELRRLRYLDDLAQAAHGTERWLFENVRKYPYTPKQPVISQAIDGCADAACRMLAQAVDKRLVDEVRKGATIPEMMTALQATGIKSKFDVATTSTKLRRLMNGRPAIISLPAGEVTKHVIIVDAVENGMVYIRDPGLDGGRAFAVTVEDFFEEAFYGVGVIYLE